MEIQSIKQRFGIIGNAPELNYALDVASRVAPTNLTVLINGESGVGKEVFSQIIHALSPRKHNKFIAVNCGAIPEGTIDSELFGHEKGAFTGATDSRKGYFESVDGGTIFLDEVGELPLGTQSRLLRVLESGEFMKVGSSKVQRTDVRVVAATNVSLIDAVSKGKFREDLYYRLNTVPIRIPPLRERADDIHILFRKFAVDFAEKYRATPIRLDDEARQILQSYRWPGNVRELKNVAEQASVLARDKDISAGEIRQFIPESPTHLPALRQLTNGEGNAHMSDRELLYQILFDMKKDVHELKRFMYHIQQSGELDDLPAQQIEPAGDQYYNVQQYEPSKPVVINPKEESRYEEQVEESLSLADKEKELIIKALNKHKGKRKNAAMDLGISERTLYRKIKEYDIRL